MKNLFAAFGLIGFLFSSPVAAGEGVTRQDLLHSVPTPVEKVSLVWTARVVGEDENKIVGMVALYDDPGTERPVDYMEVYDAEGDLLAFGWFDRFGIERIAVDNGFLGATQEPVGTFVILVNGNQV